MNAQVIDAINTYELPTAVFPRLKVEDAIQINEKAKSVNFCLVYGTFGGIVADIALKESTLITSVCDSDPQNEVELKIKSWQVADNALAVIADFDDVICVKGLQFALTDEQLHALNNELNQQVEAEFHDMKPHQQQDEILEVI